MSYLRLFTVVLALLAVACDDTPDPVDAGPTGTDAGTPPLDAGPPQVGQLESFATLATNSEGIAFGTDPAGQPTLYVGVLGANELATISPDGTVSTFASVPRPLGIAVRANGNLVVCGKVDMSTDAAGVIYEVTPAGVVTTLLSEDPSGAPFVLTNYVAIAPDDSIVFGDSEADLLYRADADGTNVALVTDTISYPNGLAFSADGATLYVASWDSSTIWGLPFDSTTGVYGTPVEFLAGVDQVDGIVTMASGELVLVTSSDGVQRTMAGGAPTQILLARRLLLPANGAAGVGAYGDEWVYLSSLGNDEVWRVRLDEPGAPLPAR